MAHEQGGSDYLGAIQERKKTEQQQKASVEQNKITQRSNLQFQLNNLEANVADLKVLYEQFFAGILPRAPEKEHQLLKRQIRELHNAPFKSSAINFRLKTLETRYSTLNTYWMRVLKQKEDGTYHKDQFRSDLKDRRSEEDARMLTNRGQAERGMKDLYSAYKHALEKQTGKKQGVDFESFQRSLAQRAKNLKESQGVENLSFQVVIRDGKVSVQAKAK